MKGIAAQTLDWITHPAYSEASIGEWAAGMTLILMVSFLWTLVIRQIE